ncbi:CbtA family protein [Hyphomicrobium sp.]|uniref:CbtA family protein n=1 Tax=Hyphomicrobium sp. TaxID=82 RepID=UPI0025C05229|nr:CbtA family protein [Hyphomicrobium sp.]MCC7252916.1 CbtA family protein [Hyphomicrobium sp.]
MITRVLAAGLAAGFVAGLLVALLQHFTTTPLILAAEVYENQVALDARPGVVLSGMHGARLILAHVGHDAAPGAEAGDAWAPADGLERTVYASTVTVATAVGFAFLLLAGMLVAGDAIDRQRALSWAAAGFVVTGLAPAFGLPPELPGMHAADLLDRQVWWIGTAVATATGLWLLLRSRGVALPVLGLALLLAPHVIGAPHPADAGAGRVPAELAARFASVSLSVHAVLWVLVGVLAGWFWQRNETPVVAEA